MSLSVFSNHCPPVRPPGSNPGIVPPWLVCPPTLPVEPGRPEPPDYSQAPPPFAEPTPWPPS